MATHETKRGGRASAAIAALLASGVMFAGPAGVAVADPAPGHGTSATSENRIHSGPLSLGQIRAHSGHPRLHVRGVGDAASDLASLRLQQIMDRSNKTLAALSNILKRTSNHSPENVK